MPHAKRENMTTKAVGSFVAVALAIASGASAGELVYGVTNTQTLVTWDSASPGGLLSGTVISGLQSNEVVRAIDFRPATGQLYALGSFSNLYTINTGNGAATRISGASFAPTLNGSAFGLDFNPMIDRIRVVSDADQNLVLHPDTAAVTVATNLFYAAGDPNVGANPNVVEVAYSNNFVGTPSTQLYGIDSALNILVKQANSAGTLTTVGPLGANVTNLIGFDISGASGVAFAASQDVSQSISMFWTINLATGAGTAVGQIGGGTMITAMSVAPTPGSAALLLLGVIPAFRRRR